LVTTHAGGPRIEKLAFLTPGNYADDHPFDGLEETLRLFEFGEDLGFSGAWIRQRHLEHGVSAAAVFLAAASQRTSRIELGSAVIPIGYESPFRLGEDLSTADVLSRGRLNVGVSAGVPPHAELMAGLVFDGDWQGYDFSYGRVERLIESLRGEYLGDEDTRIYSPGNVQRPRLQPHSPGLVDRLWLGAVSARSTQWAAEQGLRLLIGNIARGEGTDDFVTAQLAQIATYREHYKGSGQGEIAIGRVIVPFDSADRATREKYAAYAASRHERTLAPQGEKRTLYARDLVGTSEEIVEALRADAAIAAVGHLRLELPYEFSDAEYRQILSDVVQHVAPELGWSPALANVGE
jgi:alkanesulfonate monooxygenase SsuD/methylene tetrahydromethanopterin reductase-like flavin-dependent oxidoreductase (luciferase family)